MVVKQIRDQLLRGKTYDLSVLKKAVVDLCAIFVEKRVGPHHIESIPLHPVKPIWSLVFRVYVPAVDVRWRAGTAGSRRHTNRSKHGRCHK